MEDAEMIIVFIIQDFKQPAAGVKPQADEPVAVFVAVLNGTVIARVHKGYLLFVGFAWFVVNLLFQHGSRLQVHGLFRQYPANCGQSR